MTITIDDAIRALDRRKTAAFGGIGGLIEEPVARRLFIGFDVDLEQFNDAMLTAALAFERWVTLGRPVAMAIGGAWGDGFLTALMFTELRSREEHRP